jgi:alpha-L-rhamnosidase
MWERWDGWVPGKGFQDPGMNSFNHYAFGSVGEWLYRTAGGIDTDGAGFKKIIIKPQPGGELTFATAKYDSIRGMIESGWKIDGGKLSLKVTIPPNTTAMVHVPAGDEKGVTEGGKDAGESESVKFVKMEDGCAVYSVGSGSYEFSAPMN